MPDITLPMVKSTSTPQVVQPLEFNKPRFSHVGKATVKLNPKDLKLKRKGVMTALEKARHNITFFFGTEFELKAKNSIRSSPKKCVIYPEDYFKARWDLFQTM